MRKIFLFLFLLFIFLISSCVFALEKSNETFIETLKTNENGYAYICNFEGYSSIRVVQNVPSGYITQKSEALIDLSQGGSVVFTNYKFMNPTTSRNIIVFSIVLFVIVCLFLVKRKKQVLLFIPLVAFFCTYTCVHALGIPPQSLKCVSVLVEDSEHNPLKNISIDVYGIVDTDPTTDDPLDPGYPAGPDDPDNPVLPDPDDPAPVVIPDPVSFSTDSWETIIKAVEDDNTDVYEVGDKKEIVIQDKTYHLRIINKSTPPECNQELFDQSSCGFVLEFAELYFQPTVMGMTTSSWPSTSMRSYLNDTFYNLLPSPLKEAIINTTVLSSKNCFPTKDSTIFTSQDRIFLASVCNFIQKL